jgi:Dyp-type peroxidase family
VIHVLLLLYRPLGQLEPDRDREVADAEASGLRLVHQLTPEPLPGVQREGKFGSEHFGFIDGMGQPVLDLGGGQPPHGASGGPPIPAGEFVLGYPNAYGLQPTPPHVGPAPAGDGPRLGRNGSYLVVRQLAQDVAGFWRTMDEASRRPDGSADEHARTRLASKLVGRWPSGAPLVLAPDADRHDLATENVFTYADDPQGLRCPFGAHIRRANPRDALLDDRATAIELADRHRLVRRGRVYGPGLADPLAGDDGVERGLLFLCLNASIERQFEFVQHSWCGNPKFAGLYDEGDPLLGTGGERTFTIPDSPVRRRLTGLPQFVTTRGGAYFFLPGVAAVAALGTR